MRAFFLSVLLAFSLPCSFAAPESLAPTAKSNFRCSESYERLLSHRMYELRELGQEIRGENDIFTSAHYDKILQNLTEQDYVARTYIEASVARGVERAPLEKKYQHNQTIFRSFQKKRDEIRAWERKKTSALLVTQKQLEANPLGASANARAIVDRIAAIEAFFVKNSEQFEPFLPSPVPIRHVKDTKKLETERDLLVEIAFRKKEELSFLERWKTIPAPYRKELETAWVHSKDWYDSHLFRENSGQAAISAGESLTRRLEAGDSHATNLAWLGFEVKNGRLVPQRSFEEIAAQIAESVHSWVKEGKIAADDALYPALYFTAKDGSGQPLMIRPGLDRWPDPEKYRLEVEMPQFENRDWKKMVAEGKFPLSPSRMFEHDLAHWTEFFPTQAGGNPDLMRETRRHFRRTLKLESADDAEFHRGIDQKTAGANPSSAHARGLRTVIFTEFFVLPDVTQKAKIFHTFPQLTGLPDAQMQNWESHQKFLRTLSPSALQERAEQWAAHGKKFLTRMGGGMRDAYNFEERASVDLGKFAKALEMAAEDKKLSATSWRNNAVVNGTLLYAHAELEALLKLRAGQDFPIARSAEWEDAVRKRIAKLESGFKAGLDANLTAAQVVKDSSAPTLSPDSPTHQFLRSHTEANSPQWEAFLSPEATGIR
jgi:hypothetical protein